MDNIINSLTPRAVKALAVAKQHAALNNRNGSLYVESGDIFAALLDTPDLCLIFDTTSETLGAMKEAYLRYHGRDGKSSRDNKVNELLAENQALSAELERANIRLRNINRVVSGLEPAS